MSDEFESMLFEAEVILPAQRSWGARCAGDTSGACALMLAILEDAMRCIERGRQRRHARTRERAAEAEAWIRSDRREWLFSFASICDVLGFDADALRVRLLASPEHPATGGPAVRTEVNEPSRHGPAGPRLVPQRGDTPRIDRGRQRSGAVVAHR